MTSETNINHSLHVNVVGDIKTGKCTIVSRFAGDQSRDHDHLYIYNDNYSDKSITIKNAGELVKLIIQPVKTADSNDCIYPKIDEECGGNYIVTFSFDNRKSLDYAEKQIEEINRLEQSKGRDPVIILAGNKYDLKSNEMPIQIGQEEIDAIKNKFNVKYFDVSAKDGTNIEAIFMNVAHERIMKINNKAPQIPVASSSSNAQISQETNLKLQKNQILEKIKKTPQLITQKDIDTLKMHRKSNHFFNKAANFFANTDSSATASWRKAVQIIRQDKDITIKSASNPLLQSIR